MAHITLDINDALTFIDQNPYDLQEKVNHIHDMIFNKTGKGSDFLGWLDLPHNYDKDEYHRLIKAAKQIRSHSEVLVVIGIGGSYLGSKAGIEFLKKPFSTPDLEIVFAGHHMSGSYLNVLVEYLKDKSFSINVISKSGTTTEPAIAFRVLKRLAEEKYGIEASKKRIFATTDKAKGALHTLAKNQGYDMFVIPDDVGGRYSVLTPVGLLPLAASGIDTDQILKGAQDAYDKFRVADLKQNEAYLYAVMRYLLYTSGKKIEMLAGYEPALIYFNEWWKQLFGESEGKDHKGLFVASASFSTDLHSLGQYIQEGERHLFETIIKVNTHEKDVLIPLEKEDLDELNYLYNKKLSYVNAQALKGTMMAHKDGGVPNMLIDIPVCDAYTFGYMVYFFELACAMSAYLIDVNPFNQPGVEAYKKNMFALLGKKGYENILK
ncbi:MAG: glucose-6-phosphate isomerase [Acholeplasmataceae bacterium]